MWDISWGPTYRKSYGICISVSTHLFGLAVMHLTCDAQTAMLSIVMCFLFRQHLIQLNKKMKRKEVARGKVAVRYLY